jgi:glycosyltransferase involved in cell wall biosynthesis
LARLGATTELFSVDDKRRGDLIVSSRGYRDRRFHWNYARIPVLRGLRYSSSLSQTLHRETKLADVVHDHGIWLTPNVIAGRAAARSAKPFVISLRGMLAPAALAFSPLKKCAFWRLQQGKVVRSAACLHATSDQEYEEIRDFGLSNPVAVIRNGIDLPAAPSGAKADTQRTVLALGRIHPKKALDQLIAAWALVAPDFPDWRLRIVGPSEAGCDSELCALAQRLRLDSVSIEGPVHGPTKDALLRAAGLLVLPSLNENFGLVVAEALAAGTPVISTKGTPWRELEPRGCGWWVDPGSAPLAAALSRAMATPAAVRSAMGARGRAWMEQEYSWDSVAAEMLALYRWLTGTAEPPAFVRLD